MMYMSIMGSSVPCERLFSIAGNIASDERNLLDPIRLGSSPHLRRWMDHNTLKILEVVRTLEKSSHPCCRVFVGPIKRYFRSDDEQWSLPH
ncbi:hypothetical protein TNCV_835261 [Trichonephila clavipes]|nr:hypothetical protein TNCV_835261 [Trichonephila clavipes]